MIADLVDHFFRGGAADFGLRSGAETFGHLHAHLHDALGLRHRERLGVGIGDDEIDALQAGGDHIVDGVAARAADTEHGDAGLELTDVGDIQIDGHGCLLFVARAFSTPGPVRSATGRWMFRASHLGAIRNSREAIVRPGRSSRPCLS